MENRKVKIRNAHEARKLGIASVFQELSQIPTLSVAENIFIKQEILKANFFLSRTKMFSSAQKLLDGYGIEVKSKQLISSLPIAKRQLVEIVKATINEPKVLVLDEPTSTLTEGEAQILFKLIAHLKKQGTGIIYISHRMSEIFEIADRATILRDGKLAANLDIAELNMSNVVKHMVGRDVELYDSHTKRNFQAKDVTPALEVVNISQTGLFRDLSFKLFKGEILGIAGLVGSGRSEMVHAIFGITKRNSGKLLIDGKQINIRKVQDALDNGIAMVPENRHLQGLILMHSISDNISLLKLKEFSNAGFLQKSRIKQFSQIQADEYGVKTDSIKKPVNYLSGGNQQKVVIGKWLSIKPKILIVDELTAGIDVHSKAEIHRMLRTLADQGMAILMISSEMSELLANSDRILVMNSNRIIAELTDTSQEEIMTKILDDNNASGGIEN